MPNLKEKLEEVKAGAAKTHERLESGTDELLPHILESKFSWVFVFGWFMLGMATGFGICYALL